MTRLLLIVAILFAIACKNDKAVIGQGQDTGVVDDDVDGDGFTTEDDCNDLDATINPAVEESCDGVDNNCDGEVDEGIEQTWYEDIDGDGFGDATSTVDLCDHPEGFVPNDDDCDDADDGIYPGATELCDGIDNDCDDVIDDGAVGGDKVWHPDADGDGYGSADDALTACGQPEGYIEDDSDCDDADADMHPDADEVCNSADDDCDGEIDEDPVDPSTWYADSDGDTFGDPSDSSTACDAPEGTVADDNDCDDDVFAINPDADEICDGLDNDCDGEIDVDAIDAETWYADADDDGFGDTSTDTVSCDAPTGYTDDATDCDDDDDGVYPGADEHCDGVDEDCDGTVDDGATDVRTWYGDDDGDTYGDKTDSTTTCTPPAGYVADKTDCDDTASSVHPGADEYCNDVDDDCDGSIDDSAVDATIWYKDGDSDGYGKSSKSTTACDAPTGYVADSTDCNDAASTIHPGADEYCNSKDDDCDGTIDESAVDTLTWYADTDSDGYGDATSTSSGCTAPTGYVSNKTDCDDADADIHPSADEYCNDIDDDCDGSIDESAVDMTTWYKDGDSDGYGKSSKSTTACDAPTGYVADKTDCDDAASTIHPGADEYCNSKDDDCDGTTDESAVDTLTWYKDGDSDGYGDSSKTSTGCTAPTGYVSSKTDCDDTDNGVYPGAPEYCDGEDDDCDGSIDESAVDTVTWYKDADSDAYGDSTKTSTGCTAPTGYVADKTDCNDASSSIHPGADEYCNSKDDDCDGTIDESAVDALTWYKDGDSDTYGDSSKTSSACTVPTGYVSNKTDCDDADSAQHPGATEYCNLEDDDCDGSIDESAVDLLTWYKDSDSDAYGDSSKTSSACTAPTGYVADSTDCNDGNSTINPGAAEICDDGIDQDCDYVDALCAPTGTVDLSVADARIYGEKAYDYAANSVASAGDLDGDGLDDIVIGAYGVDTSGTNAGAAYVVLSEVTGDLSLTAADGKLKGQAAGDYAGSAVDGAGDVDGDGYDDLIIGARSEATGGTAAGAVYIYPGPATGTASLSAADAKITGAAANFTTGFAVSGAGDMDGDGYGDVFFSSYQDTAGGVSAGAGLLFLGPIVGTMSTTSYDAKLIGENKNDYAGYSVDSAGDLDGDGTPDLILGAYKEDTGATDAGAAYLVYGPVSGALDLSAADAKLTGTTASDNAGASSAGAGDTNGDGYADVLVGAYGYDLSATATDAGIAYLLQGPITGTMSLSTATATFLGVAKGDLCGTAVSGAGDVDKDGMDDILIGAWKEDTGGTDAGMAALFLGSLSGSYVLNTGDALLVGETAGDYAGASVAPAGDTNGDGYGDFLIGSWKQDLGGSDTGTAYLFWGGAY